MIKLLSLKNFRSIENAEIDFDTPLKVLIGENGTGKTNVLLALRFISNCIRINPLRAIQKAGGIDQVFRIEEERTRECFFSILLKLPDRNKTHISLLPFPIETEEAFSTPNYYVRYSFSLEYSSDKKGLRVKSESLRYGEDESSLFIIFDKNNLHPTKEEVHLKSLYFYHGQMEDLLIHNIIYNQFLSIRKSKLKNGTGNLVKHKEKIDFKIANDTLVELMNIEGYNFSPPILRKKSDILSPKKMGYNGQNFPSVLHGLLNNFSKKTSIRTNRQAYSMRPKNNKKFIPEIEGQYREILPFIQRIETKEDIDSAIVNVHFKENPFEKKILWS